MSKEVLVITQYFPPEPNVIAADIVERLSQHRRVTVVTAHPNYPLGRFYDSVTTLRPTKEQRQRTKIWRLPLFPDHSRSVVRRARSYLSFAAVAGIISPLISPLPSAVWVYNTPFTSALIALWYRLLGRRVVFTSVDLWPESMLATGVATDSSLVRAMYWYRKWIHRIPDKIICVTEGMKRQYASEGIADDRLVHIPAWVHANPQEDAREKQSDAGQRRIVYAGNLGPAQQLDVLIQAIPKLNALGHDVVLELYGAGSDEVELRRLAASVAPAEVVFFGQVTAELAFEATQTAAVQVVSLRDSPEFESTVPSKLYGSIAAGVPLVFALAGEARQIALRYAHGCEFNAGDVESLVAAVEAALSMSARDREQLRREMHETYRRRFDRNVLVDACVREILGTREGTEAARPSERNSPRRA